MRRLGVRHAARPIRTTNPVDGSDGIVDLAVSNSPLGGDQVVISYLGAGDGTFTAVQTIVGYYSLSLVGGDFNEDGHDDLIGAGSSSVQFFAGDGSGQFTPEQSLIVGDDVFLGIVNGDFDGDGHLDVVTQGGGEVIVASPTRGWASDQPSHR